MALGHPYLLGKKLGFGLNLFFDEILVDYREMHSYLFDEESAGNPERALESIW